MGNLEDDDPSVTGQFYVNSNIDSDYDGYQQAWRILGIYVDCHNYINHNNYNNNNNNNANHDCQRYLVWAAYIDLQYKGGAIGEYQFYNRTERTFDDTTCTSATTTTTTATSSNNQRCAKMDCHDTASSGTWSLMGVYKEPYYASEFFEQLFKHLGYCLWDSNTYNFMQNNYNMWPDSSGCVASATLNPITNQPYYIDLKPGPNLTLALYTDSTCYHEYDIASDDALNVDGILQNAGYLSSEQIRQFNDAMMPFYHCQPCRAYNLENVDGSLYGGDDNNNNNADASNDPNYPKYSCLDIAGYTNVNQCMKFRTKTQMLPMTRKDLHVATLQGAITHLQFYASTTAQQQLTLSSSYHSIYFQPSLNESGTSAGAYFVLSMAIILMVGTIYYCYNVFRWVLKRMRN